MSLRRLLAGLLVELLLRVAMMAWLYIQMGN